MSDFDIDFDAVETFTGLFADPDSPLDWRILSANFGGQKLRGTLDQHKRTLRNANQAGNEVFLMVNETGGHGQTKNNVTTVRAVFADLDDAPLENIQRIELEPHLVIETSPGKFHVYWLVEGLPLEAFSPLQRQIAALIGSDPNVSDLPRIMRVPGFWHRKSQPFRSQIIKVSEGPHFTFDQIRSALACAKAPARASAAAVNTANAKYSLDRGLPDNHRTEALTHLAGVLIAKSTEDSIALAKLYRWNALNQPPLAMEKIQSTYESLKQTHRRNHSPTGLSPQDIDRDYAVVVLNGSTKILRERPTLCLLSERDLHLFFRQHQITDADGKRKQLSQMWLSGPHRTFDDVVFDPSDQHLPHEYNLWKGFAVEPHPGDCTRYLDHVRNCICDGDQALFDYVVNWMAHLVQRPAELPGVALVLIGDQGTGKGSFVEPLGQILGIHYQHATQMDKVLGRFNIHMAHALLVFCDEIVWGGNKKDEGALKGLVTERDRLVEGKFQNPITLPSYLRLIFATNEPWAVPTGPKERRWCVLNVSNDHIQDTNYFSTLKDSMANGGTQALLDFLMARNISSFDVRKVPQTRGLLDQKLMSQDSVANWWYDRLTQGRFAGVTSTTNPYLPSLCAFGEFNGSQELLDDYLFNARNDRHGHGKVSNSQQLIRSMKRLCSIVTERKQANGERQRGIILPPLEDCRQQYEEFIGHDIDWQT